jgi:transposase
MSEITRVGVDLAKNVIQVHAVDAVGKIVTNCGRQAECAVIQPE